MARIEIRDLEHSEELSQDKMKGIFGGFVADQGGVGGLLSKGAGMAGEMIGGDAGGALQAAGQEGFLNQKITIDPWNYE